MRTESACTTIKCDQCGRSETHPGLGAFGGPMAFRGWIEITHVADFTRRLHYCEGCWYRIAPPELMTPDEQHTKRALEARLGKADG